MVWRPFYFSKLIVDPKDPDRVFKPNYSLIVSTDGGKSFSPTSNGRHGDHHDVWINPENTQHVISGHTLKHLTASLAGLPVLAALRKLDMNWRATLLRHNPDAAAMTA